MYSAVEIGALIGALLSGAALIAYVEFTAYASRKAAKIAQ